MIYPANRIIVGIILIQDLTVGGDIYHQHFTNKRRGFQPYQGKDQSYGHSTNKSGKGDQQLDYNHHQKGEQQPDYHHHQNRQLYSENLFAQLDSFDPVFNEIMDSDGWTNNAKRGALDLYKMVKCGTGCNPLIFKGYGCYCGFLGSGPVMDGIDRCCKMHDWCYSETSCMNLEWSLPYFVPYKWTCNGGAPYCVARDSRSTKTGSCGHQLCECDRELVECLKEFPCPHKKTMCKTQWKHWQNIFMGIENAKELSESYYHHHHHQHHHP